MTTVAASVAAATPAPEKHVSNTTSSWLAPDSAHGPTSSPTGIPAIGFVPLSLVSNRKPPTAEDTP